MISRIRQITALTLALGLVLMMAVGGMAAQGADGAQPVPMVMAAGADCPACHTPAPASGACAQLHFALPISDRAEIDRPVRPARLGFADFANLCPQTSHRPGLRPA